MNNVLIMQVECKGKAVTLLKQNNQFKVVDNQDNEYKNVLFINQDHAMIKFNELMQKIIQ